MSLEPLTLEHALDLYAECLPGWARLYVRGVWTLEQFERHADAMRDGLLAQIVRA